ncbi:MAG: phenylacetic acid degradation protein [bacterium]|nr:phenylacetic acid degradation protein [bacterium]
MRLVAVAVMACVALTMGRQASAGLQDYVDRPDPSCRVEAHSTIDVAGGTAHVLRLTSQTWKGIVWQHWLTVFRPDEVRHPDKAILLITGGSNGANGPNFGSSEAMVIAGAAARTGTLAVVLEQVPNQPLFGGLSEDGIISYTFEKYLDTGDPDWPLLLPMTKSVVRAMDAVQDFSRRELGHEVTGFFTLGGSKRGWTTWLSAVADDRVFGIAPVVIDTLNLGEQMAHQFRSYGAYSDQIADYTNRGIQERMQTVGGQRLLSIVDPYSYREDLSLPKMVCVGTNDPYWTVDSANLYFPGLKAPKHLRYSPNTGHDIDTRGVGCIVALYVSLVEGKPLPGYGWNQTHGALSVNWTHDRVLPLLWQATSATRDFREANWEKTELPATDGRCTVRMEAPGSGWMAYYVELLHEWEGIEYGVCTQMTVLPASYPVATSE